MTKTTVFKFNEHRFNILNNNQSWKIKNIDNVFDMVL